MFHPSPALESMTPSEDFCKAAPRLKIFLPPTVFNVLSAFTELQQSACFVILSLFAANNLPRFMCVSANHEYVKTLHFLLRFRWVQFLFLCCDNAVLMFR